jgi:putative ABC transport system permease protein
MLPNLVHLSRNLHRSPASAVAAILTLALTLGAAASIFAVVQGVLLTPPPFSDPDTLVLLNETTADDPSIAARRPSYATFEAWRARAGSLAALEAFDGTNLTLTGFGLAERVSVTDATPGLPALLGITPARGRGFDIDDAGRPVVIVSDDFWRQKLGGDPGAVGHEIVLGSRSHTVVGILPEQFRFELNASDVWRPIPLARGEAAGDGYRVRVLARVPRDVPQASLAVALDEVSRTSAPPARVVATPVTRAISGAAAGTLGLLAGGAGLAMLIAFANFAGLLVVRSIDRRRELAIRNALGASRSEIARQVWLEAQALVAIGTAGGVALALWLTPFVSHLVLPQFGGVAQREIAVSWQVIGAVILAAYLCAWICALLPARMAARQNAADVLRRGATPPTRERLLRRVLVTAEIALAFVLLVSVMLLGRSLMRVLTIDPGFDARGVMTLQVSLPAAAYSNPERVESFYSSLQRALEGRLGSRAVSVVDELPLTGDGGRRLVRERSTDAGREAVVRTASPGYFGVMRIPVVAGRTFDAGDDRSAPPRIVISRSLAERLFPFEGPIGRQVQVGAAPQAAEIVGVVGDVTHRALGESPLPTVYVSALQLPSHSSILVVRSEFPDSEVVGAVRQEVARLDADVPVYRTRSMQDVVAASPGVPARRVVTATFIGFAVLAVALGVIGLFGVVAHDVASRRLELAVRVALGASPIRVVRATFGQGAVMVGSALAAGGLLSMWAARALSGTGIATDRLDLLSVGAPATLLGAAAVAAILPAARRAARTDPLIALRGE